MKRDDDIREDARFLFGAARVSAEGGDQVEALRLLEQALALFDQIGDAQNKSVTLSSMAEICARSGSYPRAILLWEQVLPLVDQIGDVRGRSLTLDRMAKAFADQKNWPRALELWQQALDIDTQLGGTADRAATLSSMAGATAHIGDAALATQLWNQALEAFEEISNLPGQAATLRGMAQHAADLQEWDDSLRLHQRALTVSERLGDLRLQGRALDGMGHACFNRGDAAGALAHWQGARSLAEKSGDVRMAAVVLGSIGSCTSNLGDIARAVDLWEQSLAVLDDIGDDRNRTEMLGALALAAAKQGQPIRAMALWHEQLDLHQKLDDSKGKAATLRMMAQPLDSFRAPATAALPKAKVSARHRVSRLSLSEYDVTPSSAPFFPLGELWASLHARGFHLRSVARGTIGLRFAGTATVTSGATLVSGLPFDPEYVASDLIGALSRYSAQEAGALLAGYARLGYEYLDVRHPGFTDAVLDRLEVPEPRPRPAPPPLDVGALLHGLGAELRIVDDRPVLGLATHRPATDVWKDSSREAFLLVLSLLVAGVDCRAIFKRDSAWYRLRSVSPLYRLLWPKPARKIEVHELAQYAPGMELAVGLGHVLRAEGLKDPFEMGEVLFWVRKVLVEGPADQAVQLGDALIDSAMRCAQLVANEAPSSFMSEALAQKGIIILEYTGGGQRSDEGRLMALTRNLHACPWYPQPFSTWPSAPHLGTCNSWLITYRQLAAKSLDEQKQGRPGVLRSAALRGIGVARRLLPAVYRAAGSRDPETAAPALPLLRVVVKSYAALLVTLWESASVEKATLGSSGWLPFFEEGITNGYLARETGWISEFLTAAGQEGFSLDVARVFMRRGEAFYAEDNVGSSVPIVTDFS